MNMVSGPALAIGKAGDCLGPRDYGGASKIVTSHMPVHGQQNTSLFVHWILLNCHLLAIKPVNVAVSKQGPPSECLRNERILQVLKQKAK